MMAFNLFLSNVFIFAIGFIAGMIFTVRMALNAARQEKNVNTENTTNSEDKD